MIFESRWALTSLLACGLLAFQLFRWVFGLLWMRVKYDLHKMPGPPGLPIIGHVRSLAGGSRMRFNAQMHRWALEFGKVYRLTLLGKDIVVVSDPKFIQNHVYAPGENDMPKSDSYKRNFNKLMSPYNVSGVFTTSKVDAKYKSFRKTLACAFSTEALKRSYPALLAKVNQCAAEIRSLTKDGSSVDVQNLALRMVFDSIGRFAYGLDFDALGNGSHPLLSAMGATAEDTRANASNPLRKLYKKLAPFSAAAQHSKRMYELLYREYDKVFDAVNLFGDPPAEDDPSLRAQLMRLKNPLKNDARATKEEIYGEMTTFLIAGTDSTSHQLMWILLCLSTYLDVQDRVYDELKEHGLAGAGGVDPEYAILSKLPYLNCVLKEGMRLIPVTPGASARISQTDLDVVGYRVPRGTTIMAPRRTLNTCPWMWENGQAFDPDRWTAKPCGLTEDMDGSGASRLDSEQKLWTFGAGARGCVGQRLAVMSLQVMLIVLLSKFRFTLDPRMGGFQGALDRGFDSVAFCCEGGMWLRASPRE